MSVYISRELSYFYNQKLRFWLFLCLFAVLKISAISLKYLTFIGVFFIFLWVNQTQNLSIICTL